MEVGGGEVERVGDSVVEGEAWAGPRLKEGTSDMKFMISPTSLEPNDLSSRWRRSTETQPTPGPSAWNCGDGGGGEHGHGHGHGRSSCGVAGRLIRISPPRAGTPAKADGQFFGRWRAKCILPDFSLLTDLWMAVGLPSVFLLLPGPVCLLSPRARARAPASARLAFIVPSPTRPR